MPFVYTQINTFGGKKPNRHFTLNITLLDQAKTNVYRQCSVEQLEK